MVKLVSACSSSNHADIIASQQNLEAIHSKVEDDVKHGCAVVQEIPAVTGQLKAHDNIGTEDASARAGAVPNVQSTAGKEQLMHAKPLQSPQHQQQARPEAYKGVTGEESKRRARGAVVLDTPTIQASVGTKHNSIDRNQEGMMSLSDLSPGLQEKDNHCRNCCKTMDTGPIICPISVVQPVVDDATDSPKPGNVDTEQPTMLWSGAYLSLPGAYLGLPGEAMRPAPPIDLSIVGAHYSREVVWLDDTILPFTNHQQQLARAIVVDEEAEHGTMMHADAVDPDKIQNLQLTRKKQQCFFTIALILLLLAGAIMIGYVVGTQPKTSKEVVTIQVPISSLSMEPSEAPSSAATRALDILLMDLPLHTQHNILNGNTPQYQAWEWLSKHQNITNLPDWRKKQLFALATFFFAFEGEHWNRLIRDSWMDDTKDECLWFSSGYGRFVGEEYIEWSLEVDGIPKIESCNNLGELIWLDLADLQVSGFSPSIPPEIGLLTSLTCIGLYDDELELPWTNFTGLIYPELGGLISLRHLVVGNNKISGPISSELGLLTTIEALFLGNNAFSGILFTELGEMTSLTFLSLDSNSFSGSIPSELGRLTNLGWLQLQNLPLMTGSIPSEVALMASLRHLDLRNSSGLHGIIPDELCYLQHPLCTFVDIWGVTSNCTLEFDCTEVLCGCDCPCDI
jgi:hypothetical protein